MGVNENGLFLLLSGLPNLMKTRARVLERTRVFIGLNSLQETTMNSSTFTYDQNSPRASRLVTSLYIRSILIHFGAVSILS